ncbi:bifunctional folylpolyglutamate synthase/dihydrofolate synthase [Janibacter limosus]|uniref:bifunctional folylpolyglutamate synthase/dihydrofolate synthase n=1 Tax=Janibacter limosus TaxID=53458 RepID=UPI00082BD8DC|nr:folylpolyglutamate synthase/dihydrofolate synthase family protein [Janibacter limosus]
MSPAPDAAQRQATADLELRKRMRQVEDSILERAPEHDLEPSLDRIRAVMDLLGEPQRTFPVIHVTGTNGKTSTARIIESILRESGLKTGRFTSPHLQDIRERITIGGELITREAFLAAWADIAPFVDAVDTRSVSEEGPRMTYFEVLVALAYAAFADAPVDVAIVEVGMGGSWDATNVVEADVAVITPIGIDHQHFLGNSIEEIATEKSGIIHPDAITVSAPQDEEVMSILRERADEVGAQLKVEGIDFGVLTREVAVGGQMVSLRGIAGEHPDLLLNLHGAHQASNAALAVAAVEAFIGGGEQPLTEEVLAAGLASATSPGRLEIVRRSPTVIVDAAHNPHGAAVLAEALEDSFTFTHLVGVVSIFKDKDVVGILEALEPALDEIVVTRSTSPRAMRPDRLGEIAAEVFGDHRVTVIAELPDALDHAAQLADEGGVAGGVVATGSIVTVAEVRLLLGVTDVEQPTRRPVEVPIEVEDED